MKRYKFNNLKDFSTNTKAACYLESLNLPYKTLLGLLKTDEFHLKYFALVNLNSIDSAGMDILIFNLTGQDSKIRESASLNIKNFILKNPSLIKHLEQNLETVSNTLNDVNPQVCRNMIEVFGLFQHKDALAKKILSKINLILKEVDIENTTKSHKFNKFLFNLYWNLYGLENLISQNSSAVEPVFQIIKELVKASNYTIRERAAKIILKLESCGFEVEDLKNILKNDENFYVRIAISQSSLAK